MCSTPKSYSTVLGEKTRFKDEFENKITSIPPCINVSHKPLSSAGYVGITFYGKIPLSSPERSEILFLHIKIALILIYILKCSKHFKYRTYDNQDFFPFSSFKDLFPSVWSAVKTL